MAHKRPLDDAAADSRPGKHQVLERAEGKIKAALEQLDAAAPAPASDGPVDPSTAAAVRGPTAYIDPDTATGLPTGWLDCPPMGKPVGFLIPIKVPLGRAFDFKVPAEKKFSPQTVVERLHAQGKQVGLVIDLTNTWRYYDVDEWKQHGVQHEKVAMKGRGAVPEPDLVNVVFWIAMVWRMHNPDKFVVVHCTHGFNRTGYVVATIALRLGFSNTVEHAVRDFAAKRPPGIYKDDYLQALFKYHHERRPSALLTPPVPDWKAGEPASPEHEDPAPVKAEPEAHIEHDDVIGEALCDEEIFEVQRVVMEHIMGPGSDAQRLYFPGSQPVSLAAANLELLRQRRYWVTWKADGTRYMLLLSRWGVYLIDRAFRVRRLQMRFPTPSKDARKPVGPLHHNTLLDGEMVVDENLETGVRERRFLVYDIMMLNGTPIVDKPFKERFFLIEDQVLQPRNKERRAIVEGRFASRYTYQDEPFHVRRKEFWPLVKMDKVLSDMIPNLSHEADGLIFQGYNDVYKPGTCEELLKWKFAHLNSVDFLLRFNSQGGMELCLLQTHGRDRGLRPLEGAKIIFPAGEDPLQHNNAVIECSYSQQDGAWVYMRPRRDKDMPNAWHVYEKVAQSIEDNLTAEVIQEYVDNSVTLPIYDRDRLPHAQIT